MDRLLEYAAHHPWLAAFAVVAALVVLVYELRARAQTVGALAPQDVIRLMNQNATVLDVRPQQDYAAGHIAGARSYDASQLASSTESLKKYRDRPLIIYCESGSTAGAAVRVLTRAGFTKVFSLRGGLAAWRGENLPLSRD